MRARHLLLLASTFAVAGALGASCTFPDFAVVEMQPSGGGAGGTGGASSNGGSGGSGGATSSSTSGGAGGTGGIPPDPMCTGSGGTGGAGAAGGTGAAGGGGAATGGAGGAGGAGGTGPDPCDADGDGQRAIAYPCCGKDCDDGNPDAFYGQTAYFAEPDLDLADGGFDYDCDNKAEQNPEQLLNLSGELECDELLCLGDAEGYTDRANCGQLDDQYYKCTGVLIGPLCSASLATPTEPLRCK